MSYVKFKSNNILRWFLVLKISLLMFVSCDSENADHDLLLAPALIETGDVVISPPEGSFNPFYKKYLNANGIPVVSSEFVEDSALILARHTIINMTAKRPDVLAQMVLNRARVGIIAEEEETSNLPEYANIEDKEFFNRRGRGYGGGELEPFASASEEAILNKYKNAGYDLLQHEFAHLIHSSGLRYAIPGFQRDLKDAFKKAKKEGLWANTYAATDENEYFAESTSIWFNYAVQSVPEGDGVYNHIHTREELKEYDLRMYNILKEVYNETDWKPLGLKGNYNEEY